MADAPVLEGETARETCTRQEGANKISQERDVREEKNSTGVLNKKIGFVGLYSYIVGGIIGSGIYVSPVRVIRTLSSGWAILSLWLVGGLMCIFGGLSFIELGSYIPDSGGQFAYLQKGFSLKGRKPFNVIGAVLAFSTIWTSTFFIWPAGIAIVALTFSEYLVRPFIPLYCEIPRSVLSLIGIASLIVLGLINSFTQKGASVLMVVFTFIKLLSMGFIVVLGLSRLISGDTHTLTNTFHAPLKSTAGAGVVVVAMYNIMFAFEGWSNVSSFVEEVKSIKTLPFATILATLTVTAIYMSVNLAYLCVLNLEELDSLAGEAIAVPFGQKVIGKAGLAIIPVLVAISTFGGNNAGLFVISRIAFAASRKGFLPSSLSGLHVKYATPIPAIIMVVIIASLYISFGSISFLIDSFSSAVWVYYALVFSSLLIMRVTYRKEKRPFKVFFVIPLLMVLVSVAFVVIPIKDQPLQSLGAFGGILLSVPVYFLFIYDGPLPGCMHWYKTMRAKLSKFDKNLADVVNSFFCCSPPAVPVEEVAGAQYSRLTLTGDEHENEQEKKVNV